MARTILGAIVEMIRRELASKYHRDLVLEFEAGPVTSRELAEITKQLQAQFPGFKESAAGGDADYWKVTVHVRPYGQSETLRQELLRWAVANKSFVRKYAVRQRSLWGSRK